MCWLVADQVTSVESSAANQVMVQMDFSSVWGAARIWPLKFCPSLQPLKPQLLYCDTPSHVHVMATKDMPFLESCRPSSKQRRAILHTLSSSTSQRCAAPLHPKCFIACTYLGGIDDTRHTKPSSNLHSRVFSGNL